MDIKTSIQSNSEEFIELCKSHDVAVLFAFGSSVNGNFDDSRSDIDLLVEINTQDPVERGEILMDLWQKFEEFFQRKVDLLTDKSIRNPFLRKSIEATKLLIYDGKRQEVSI